MNLEHFSETSSILSFYYVLVKTDGWHGYFKIILLFALKVVSALFLLVYFLCLKESTCNALFSILRQLTFKFSDIQMSWCHQMPKDEIRIHFIE